MRSLAPATAHAGRPFARYESHPTQCSLLVATAAGHALRAVPLVHLRREPVAPAQMHHQTKSDDPQMLHHTKGRATKSSSGCVIPALLSIIAILLSGILAALCVLTYHVVPLLQASQPIVASIDPVAIKPYIVKAGRAVNGAAGCA